jgi:hypothetical protein
MKIYQSVWGSIVHFANELIADLHNSEGNLSFIDWETHANIHELPDQDMLGPMAVTITELTPQMFEVTFAIAVSTYATDDNLFRMKAYLGEVFERMRVNKQIRVFDNETAEPMGYMIITDGTLLAPMSRAETRPFQYVQASALLEPLLT